MPGILETANVAALGVAILIIGIDVYKGARAVGDRNDRAALVRREKPSVGVAEPSYQTSASLSAAP